MRKSIFSDYLIVASLHKAEDRLIHIEAKANLQPVCLPEESRQSGRLKKFMA
jgi:hypothetical protein